jgi:hypothetical protein
MSAGKVVHLVVMPSSVTACCGRDVSEVPRHDLFSHVFKGDRNQGEFVTCRDGDLVTVRAERDVLRAIVATLLLELAAHDVARDVHALAAGRGAHA